MSPDDHRDGTYTLEIVEEITGISSKTIRLYQEQGLVRPLGTPGEFDDEAIHTLRRIEHLRRTCEANAAGLKLILDLLNEVESLRSRLRTMR